MPKKFPPGRCAHCLNYFDELTSDHVFPLSWYPDSTPADVEKWQMPACKQCNGEYGKLESDLLYRLGLCINPSEAKASGISEKVLRALDPKSARNLKDQRARQATSVKIMKELVELPAELPDHGILPGFGPRPNSKNEKHIGVKVDATSLGKLIVKIVKGMTYVIEGKLLDENYEIDHYFLSEEPGASLQLATDIEATLNRCGSKFERGPGVAVQRVVRYDNPDVALFLIEIWGRLKFYARVTPKSLADDRGFDQMTYKPKPRFTGHLKYAPPSR